jgi:histidinol-phosphate aminotransferase
MSVIKRSEIDFKLHPLSRKSLEGIIPYSLKQPAVNFSHIRLSDNENPYLKKYSIYPNPNPTELKSLYIKYLKNQYEPYLESNYQAELNEKNLLFCNGSDEGIDLLIRAFCEPKEDEITITTPTFSMFSHWATAYDVRVRDVPLEGRNYEKLNIQNILRCKSKLLFICNPNNPVGNLFSNEDLLSLIQNFKGVLVIDETYHEFSKGMSYFQYISQNPNLVVLRSFSKAFGLAGVRGGVIIANEAILNTLQCIKAPYSFSTPAQENIRRALLKIEPLKKTWDRMIQERERLYLELRTLSCVKHVYPSASNFLLVQFENYKEAFQKLYSAGIIVRDTHTLVNDTLRISIGTNATNSRLLKLLAII